MSIHYFCDLCGEELKKEKYFAGPHMVGAKEYCEKCWLNKKNWPLIHKKQSDD